MTPASQDGGNFSPLLWWRALRPTSFAARLGLAISLLIAAVCISQSWILAQRELEHIRGYLTDRGRTISEYLAHEAGASALTGNVDILHQLAEQARAQNGVVYTRFLDRHGLLLVSVGSAPRNTAPLSTARDGKTVGPIPVGPDVWEFQAPIAAPDLRPSKESLASSRFAPAPGESAGTVAIGISVESLHALRSRTVRAATLLTALFTLIAVLGAVLLARAITQPLKALASAADAVARGDFNARVPVPAGDEIGRLARSFNAMAESLGRSRATLEESGRALEEKVQELERANQLKSEFVATISHELRTPLNVIIGYAEMLAEGAGGAVSAEQAEMVAAIQRYSQQQLDLITNVLDFSRLNSGHISFQVARFPLEPLLQEIGEVYGNRLRDAGLRLEVNVHPDVAELETDRVKLQEILRNMVDNAIKFTEQGTISVTARPGDEPSSVTIEVTDTGVGIQAEDAGSIFDPFHQIGESRTRVTGGVGLGLSLVRQLADALGGHVSVTSSPGAGSTFQVEIPCVLPGTAPDEPAVAALDEVSRNAAALPAEARPISPPAQLAPGPGETEK